MIFLLFLNYELEYIKYDILLIKFTIKLISEYFFDIIFFYK